MLPPCITDNAHPGESVRSHFAKTSSIFLLCSAVTPCPEATPAVTDANPTAQAAASKPDARIFRRLVFIFPSFTPSETDSSRIALILRPQFGNSSSLMTDNPRFLHGGSIGFGYDSITPKSRSQRAACRDAETRVPGRQLGWRGPSAARPRPESASNRGSAVQTRRLDIGHRGSRPQKVRRPTGNPGARDYLLRR